MKKLLLLCILLQMSLGISIAQKYKDVSTLTANVTRTQHRTALKTDKVDNGKYYYKKSNKMLMTFGTAGNDKMLMNGTNYVMTTNGKSRQTSGQKNDQVKVMTLALDYIIGNQGDGSSSVANIKTEKSGKTTTVTIVPKATKKRMMFSSYVVTLHDGAVKSIRMNERGNNYTLYEFSGYTRNASVDDKLFTVKK